MADKLVSREINITYNNTGEREVMQVASKLEATLKSIENLSRSNKLSAYLKDQSSLIRKTEEAFERYNKEASVDNSKELIKTANALKAISGGDLPSVLKDAQNIQQLISSKEFGKIDVGEIFSVESFEDYFTFVDLLKKNGANPDNIFEHFDIDTEELTVANEQIAELASRIVKLEDELKSANDSSGLTALREELEDANGVLDRLKNNAARTFEKFLDTHNIPMAGYDLEGNYNPNLYREYFDAIETGSLSAEEAISNFKREYSYLLETETSFDTSQLSEFANKLNEIGKEVTEIKQSGVSTIGSTINSESSSLESFEKVVDTINELANGGDAEGVSNIYFSLGQLLTIIKEIGQVDVISLENLYGIVRNLGNLKEVKINKTSLDNLAECLERISKISNATPLISLSTIDLSKFNDLHISKASLNNLAEYLPSISNINVDQLIKLASLDFSNLNNIKIDKSSLSNLKEFINSMKIVLNDDVENLSKDDETIRAKSEFIDANKGAQNSADTSTPSLQTEADLMKQIAMSAKEAAKAKKEFADANNEVKESAASSTTDLKQEKDAMDEVSDAKKKKTKDNSSSKEKSDKSIISFTPKSEGFDDIVSKFDILKKDAKDIEEIVESTVKNKEGKYDTSYKVKYKDGRAYALGEGSSPQVLSATRRIVDGDSEEAYNRELVETYKEAEEYLERQKRAEEEIDKARKEGKKEEEAYYKAQNKERESYIKFWEESLLKRDEEQSPLKQREARSEEAYNRELQCLEEINELKIQNLTADLSDKNNNDEEIQKLEKEVALIRELREEKQLIATADGEKKVSEKQAELDFRFENAKDRESKANSDFKDNASDLKQRLKDALDANKDATSKTRAEAEDLIKQLTMPNFGEYDGTKFSDVNSNNVNSVIAKLKKDTDKIVSALEDENKRIENTGLSSIYSDVLEDSFKDIKVGDADFSRVLKVDTASGTATLEFIEQIGDKARITTVKILDMDKAINDIESNSFNIKDGNYTESTGSWKTVKTVGKDGKAQVEELSAEQKEVNSALERQLEIEKRLASIEKEKSKYSNKSLTYKKLEAEQTNLKNENKSLDETLRKYPELYSAEEHAMNLSKARSNIEEDTAKSISSQADSLRSQIEKYTNENKYTKNITSVAKKLFENTGKENLSSDDIASIREQLSALRIKSEKLDNKKLKSTSELNKFIAKLADYREKYTAMSDSEKADMDALISKAEHLKNSGDVSVGAFKDLEDSFAQLDKKVIESGHKTSGFFGMIKTRMTDMNSKFIAQFFSWQDWIRYIRQAAEMVIEVNTNITELAKVSEQNSAQIYKDLNSYSKIAKEMGATISDTISATADWSKNGYSISESKQLAEVSLLYKNVGDGIDIDTANESLISTLQGFELAASDAEHIIDVFNEVSNNNPISSAGIGEALQRSAAAFNASNTSLEKSVALVTATNEVVQDPSKVGNMWKTVSARIRGADSELTEMGEDTDGMVKSTSKLRDIVKSMTGFDIMKDDNTFKDMYEIIVGIGKEWKNLDDISQASLLEKLAGKNHSNALAAALNNVDTLEKSYSEATNSEGSARREQAEYEKSIQYSIDKTKASLQELANDALSSGVIKTFVEGANAFLNVLDFLVDDFGLLKTSAIAISGILGKKGLGLTNYVT